jgi:hypothetical protein
MWHVSLRFQKQQGSAEPPLRIFLSVAAAAYLNNGAPLEGFGEWGLRENS